MLWSVLIISTLQGQIQALDSTVVRTFDSNTQSWTDTDKEVYAFDNQGNITLFVDYDWNDDTQELLPITKEEYTYDEWGETLYLLFNWDDTTQQWIYRKKTEGAHDTNGNRTLFARYNWDTNTGQWIGFRKEEYTYSDSLLTIKIICNWDTDTQQWIAYSKNEYSYNDENREILDIEYRWYGQWSNRLKLEYQYNSDSVIRSTFSWSYAYNDWEFVGRRDQFYDAAGRLISQTGYDCAGTISCLSLYRTLWAYDADGNLLSRIEQEGGSLGGSWLTNLRLTNIYDSNGNLLTSIRENFYSDYYTKQEYTYDDNNNRIECRYYTKEFGIWMLTSRIEWEYDDANHKIISLYSNWNEDTQQWEYTSKLEDTYDSAYTYADLILPPFNEYEEDKFLEKLNHRTRYIWENGEWVYDYERAYYYSELELPIETAAPLRAYVQENTIVLTWATATETNNAGFDIQKSKDGTNWEKIAWKNGQGNSTNQHDYRHIDNSPFIGINYYRLKQIDVDGAFSYSSVVSARYINRSIAVYPNPTKDIIHISLLSDETIDDIALFDMAGRQVYHSMSGNTLDVSTLPRGMYSIKIKIGENITYEKILIE